MSSKTQEDSAPPAYRGEALSSSKSIDISESQELLFSRNDLMDIVQSQPPLQSQPLPQSHSRFHRLQEDVEKGNTACYMCCGACAMSRSTYERFATGKDELLNSIVGMFAFACIAIFLVFGVLGSIWLFVNCKFSLPYSYILH